MRLFLYNLGRKELRRIILMLTDIVTTTISYAIALWLIGWPFDDLTPLTFYQSLPLLLLIRLAVGLFARHFAWSFLHSGLSEAFKLVQGIAIGSFIFLTLMRLLPTLAAMKVPVSVYVLEFAMTTMGMGFIRYFPRYVFQDLIFRTVGPGGTGEQLPTLILGAGTAGEMILRDLIRSRNSHYRILGFVDDGPSKASVSIQGYRVLGKCRDLPQLVAKLGIRQLLIAMPSAPASKLREVVSLCSDENIQFKIVPGYAEMVNKAGDRQATLKDIQLEDLLERDPVQFDHAQMERLFAGKTVLVTGAAGSIGSELCRQLLRQDVAKLVMLDINENDLYLNALDFRNQRSDLPIICEIANIRESSSLWRVFDRHRPTIVFHAAAHKHVPLMEHNPVEALRNNVQGTTNLAELADQFNCERFVLVSTDKAVNPTSVMGATKRLAEAVVRDCNKRSRTKYMTVRFGNVLGSNGSLIKILEQQIKRGGPVTITHPEITRYFMTIPEAVGLILVAVAQDEGALCVLDMGEQFKVDHLARQMITLCGLVPDRDIKVQYIGLRPGEKMYEELWTDYERLSPSTHPKIRIAHSQGHVDVAQMLMEMRRIMDDGSGEQVSRFLYKYIPDYQPDNKAAKVQSVQPEPASKH